MNKTCLISNFRSEVCSDAMSLYYLKTRDLTNRFPFQASRRRVCDEETAQIHRHANVAPSQLDEEVLKSHGVFFGRFFCRQASARCQDSVMPHSANLRWNSGDSRGITSWNVQRIRSR